VGSVLQYSSIDTDTNYSANQNDCNKKRANSNLPDNEKLEAVLSKVTEFVSINVVWFFFWVHALQSLNDLGTSLTR